MPSNLPRQLIACRDLRFPVSDEDGATQGEIRQAIAGQDPGNPQTLEDFLMLVRSQIRLVQGTQSWTLPPSPVDPGAGSGPFEPGVGQVLLLQPMDGAQDGTNGTFVLSHKAVPQSVILHYNGLPQAYGAAQDYVLEESVSDGGFDTVRLTGALAPTAKDVLRVTFVRSG